MAMPTSIDAKNVRFRYTLDDDPDLARLDRMLKYGYFNVQSCRETFCIQGQIFLNFLTFLEVNDIDYSFTINQYSPVINITVIVLTKEQWLYMQLVFDLTIYPDIIILNK